MTPRYQPGRMRDKETKNAGVSSQCVILSRRRRICAQMDDAEAHQDPLSGPSAESISLVVIPDKVHQAAILSFLQMNSR